MEVSRQSASSEGRTDGVIDMQSYADIMRAVAVLKADYTITNQKQSKHGIGGQKMAILIKGMEIPDSCFLCRFCRRQEYGEYVGEDTAWSCVASKKRITDGQDLIATFKHPGCPLVEAAEVQNAVSRQAAIDVIRFECGEWTGLAKTIENKINELPPAQPELLSDAYKKAVWTWLLDYQIKASELKGRYTPYEVLSWVANDWRKEHERSD